MEMENGKFKMINSYKYNNVDFYQLTSTYSNNNNFK
jgi:hypothetical protein